MSSLEELNKKLLEWVGWKRIHPGYLDETVDPPMQYYARWEFHGERSYIVSEPPDLTGSLDACERWLFPKLFDMKLARWDETIWVAWVQEHENGVSCEARDKDLALAFCKAIEELLEADNV